MTRFGAIKGPLILASGSSIRARLLGNARISHEIEAAEVDESAIDPSDPGERARRRALAKARAVAARRPDRLVLGVDQVFTLDGAYVEKPATVAEVEAKLTRMSGRTHEFHCAATLVRDEDVLWETVEVARVTFFELATEEIQAYARSEEGIGCAGGYRLEEGGVRLIRAIDGDHFTVLGLPMLPLVEALRRLDARDALGLVAETAR